MKWREAVTCMNDGSKIARKSWKKHRFLYLKNGVLLDQDNNEYLHKLETCGQWVRVFTCIEDAFIAIVSDGIF